MNQTKTPHEYPKANKTTAFPQYSNTSEAHNYHSVGEGQTQSFLSVEHIGIIAGCITSLVSLVFILIVTLVVIVKRHRTESSGSQNNIRHSILPANPEDQSNPQIGMVRVNNSYQLLTAPEIKHQAIIALGDLMPSIPSSSYQHTYSEVDNVNRSVETECRPPRSNFADSECQGQDPDGHSNESTYSSLRLDPRCIVNPYDTFTSANATQYRQKCENDELTSRHLNEVQYSQQGHKNQSTNDFTFTMINELSSEFKDDTDENRLELGNDFLREPDIYVNNIKAFQDDFKLNGQRETLYTGTTAIFTQVVPNMNHNKDFRVQI